MLTVQPQRQPSVVPAGPPDGGPASILDLRTSPDSPRPGRRRRHRLMWARLVWWQELLTIGAAYLLYEASRALVAPQRALAVAHGFDIVRIERWAHLDPERTLNHLINLSDPLSDAAGYYYSTLHFAVTPIVLAYLWWRHPEAYPRLRSALVLATGVALVVFISWPVAPPRFTVPGLTDTLVRDHILGLSNPHGVTGLINQYAAMPSLHVGWAVWCAAAIAITARSKWRYLAWLYPAATTFVVLATANHYLLDVVGGAALVLVAFVVTDVFRLRAVRVARVVRVASPVTVPANLGSDVLSLVGGDPRPSRQFPLQYRPRPVTGPSEDRHARCRRRRDARSVRRRQNAD